MPKRETIKKVLVLGSGPVVIGQGAEFDDAALLACKALKQDGVEVVLVDSNPVTLATDGTYAAHTYMEPLTVEVVKRIIALEKPDSLLATFGGETAFELGLLLSQNGYLEEQGIALLGVNLEALQKAEDKHAFQKAMAQAGEPCVPLRVVDNLNDALAFAGEVGYPVRISPAYTMGKPESVFCSDWQELSNLAKEKLAQSRTGQIFVEKSIAGWKELEYEIVRDQRGNSISICSMENIDPVGIHTGDSVVVAPAQTLTDEENKNLRASALGIVDALNVSGVCNVKFALRPDGGEYAVLEASPRISRSTVLASRVTGYPVSLVAAKIALGYDLTEIPLELTGCTTACNEPALDYCAVKLPKWSFDQLESARRTLGTKMKATGEVLALASSFEMAFMKAIRSVGLGLTVPCLPVLEACSKEELLDQAGRSEDTRIFVVAEALRKGASLEEVNKRTNIDPWFLEKLKNIGDEMESLRSAPLTPEAFWRAKRKGFLDETIQALSGQDLPEQTGGVYKAVDTCAAEFPVNPRCYYATADEETEAQPRLNSVLVLGSGANAIGQGAECDYGLMHCIQELRRLGKNPVVYNNNPMSVTTDSALVERLYLEPLCAEDLSRVLETEKPESAVLAFGGKSALSLGSVFEKAGVPVLGTSLENMRLSNRRADLFHMLESYHVQCPPFAVCQTVEEMDSAAQAMGYPVLVKQQEKLKGLAYNKEELALVAGGNPAMIEKYIRGKKIELNLISDGSDNLITGIMENVERSDVNPGDSILIYPTQTVTEKTRKTVTEYAHKIAKALQVVGLADIQFVEYNLTVYVTNVQFNSNRTVPFITKAAQLPVSEIATRCALGEKLHDMGYGTGEIPAKNRVAVRAPVFSFETFQDVDTQLGMEMKSTGEVMGLAHTYPQALFQALVASGNVLRKKGSVLITVRNNDKQEVIRIADQLSQLGFNLYATAGTAKLLNSNFVAASAVKKIHEGSPNTLDLLQSGKISYLISTSTKGRLPTDDDVKIRRKAVERKIPCFTALDTASALVQCLSEGGNAADAEFLTI